MLVLWMLSLAIGFGIGGYLGYRYGERARLVIEALLARLRG